jgi:hypothetical protein
VAGVAGLAIPATVVAATPQEQKPYHGLFAYLNARQNAYVSVYDSDYILEHSGDTRNPIAVSLSGPNGLEFQVTWSGEIIDYTEDKNGRSCECVGMSVRKGSRLLYKVEVSTERIEVRRNRLLTEAA